MSVDSGPKRAMSVGDLTEEAIYCRAYGHGWVYHGDTQVGKGIAKGWRVTQVCTCCGTLKLFTLSRKGEMSEKRYIYPDYYLAKFFIGAEERAEFRLNALADKLKGYPTLHVVAGGKTS
jgi:hypothetical protein